MKNIIITLHENNLDRLEEMASIFRKDGLMVENVFPFGVITGKASEQLLGKLKRYSEVASISFDESVQLPPRDSEIQ